MEISLAKKSQKKNWKISMGIIFLIILGIVIAAIISGSNNGKDSLGRGVPYADNRDYDDDDDYEDYETKTARGDRNYFSDDSAEDYNSYYAQVDDDAMMGDESAIDEMRGEFGEGEW